MRSQPLRVPAQALKARVLREIDRRGLQLVPDPFDRRLVRTIRHCGIETVIDGGANTGQTGASLRHAGFEGWIHSVEPLGAAFRVLEERARLDAKWTTTRAALSDREGSVTMHVSANSVSSSVLPMLAAHSDAAPDSAYVAEESVAATTIDALVGKHDMDPATTMLKLDVQGFEKTAFAGCVENIDKFAAVQAELSYVPLYEGQWLAGEVTEFLGDHGYELWMFDPAAMHDPQTGRLLQCDGVFVRR